MLFYTYDFITGMLRAHFKPDYWSEKLLKNSVKALKGKEEWHLKH
jgi:hypothetical protein